LTIIASGVRWRDFLPLRRWRGACCHYPTLVFGGALVVEKAGLDWQKFEG
jgi:hypothetical protein